MGGERRMGVYNSDKKTEQPVKAAASVLELLSGCSIIAAVNSIDTFEAALLAPTRAIYLLTGNPLN